MSERECSELRSLIDNSETIVLCCHVNADGDALGAMLGWAEVLKALGKEPLMVAPDQFPDYLKWLPNQEKIVRYDRRKDYVNAVLKIADTVFCLDFNTLSRTDAMEDALKATKAKKVLIDHHLEPDVDAVLTFSHPEMSSTCELVFRLVWQMGMFEQLGKHFAVPVYCGMMTDTGAFTYNSTKPEIFLIIAYLLAKNIDKDKIYRNIYHVFSVDKLRLWGYVMNKSLKVKYPPHHASYFALSKEDMKKYHFKKGDAEGLVNVPLKILDHKLSISLREDTEKNNLVWVSARSVDDFPCDEMAARFFNGGGHKNAAGGRLECSLKEAEEIVDKTIKAYADKLK